MDAPGPIPPTNVAAQWLDRLRRFCLSLQILPGPTYRVRRTTSGTILDILPTAGGGVSAYKIDCYIVHSVSDETISCKKWNGTAEVGSEVQIAKPVHLRKSYGGEQNVQTPNGPVSYTFSNWNWTLQSRDVVGSDGTSETEYIVPRYNSGNKIWADNSPNNGVSGVELMDCNKAGRYWSAG